MRAREFRLSSLAVSQFTAERERGSAVGHSLRKSQNVTLVHFTQALLTVIKPGSNNPRKSQHVNPLVLTGWPMIGGRGAGSRGQMTLFKTFKQLSYVETLAGLGV